MKEMRPNPWLLLVYLIKQDGIFEDHHRQVEMSFERIMLALRGWFRYTADL
jgi:hypothetical protein